MELKSIRTLNLVGTVLLIVFGIIGAIQIMALPSIMDALLATDSANTTELPGFINDDVCLIAGLVILVVVLVCGFVFYKKTVVDFDKKKYRSVRIWTFVAAVVSFFTGGIVPFLLYLISAISIKKALQEQKRQTDNYLPPPPPQYNK